MVFTKQKAKHLACHDSWDMLRHTRHIEVATSPQHQQATQMPKHSNSAYPVISQFVPMFALPITGKQHPLRQSFQIEMTSTHRPGLIFQLKGKNTCLEVWAAMMRLTRNNGCCSNLLSILGAPVASCSQAHQATSLESIQTPASSRDASQSISTPAPTLSRNFPTRYKSSCSIATRCSFIVMEHES